MHDGEGGHMAGSLMRRFSMDRNSAPRPILVPLFIVSLVGLVSTLGSTPQSMENYRQPILRANVRLPRARAMEFMKLRVVLRDRNLRCPDFSGTCQKILSVSQGGAVLEIRRPGIPRSEAAEEARTEEARECLAANDYIQSESPQIESTAVTAIGAEDDPFRAALKLQNWVSDNIKVERGIVLSPSLEVLKNRRGTSLGAAVLLAALTRALRFPSRVVLGYVYISGFFLGQAWMEIQAGPDWIPLDPSLPGEGIADAARISLCASSLKNGLGSVLGKGGSGVFGQLDLKILEYAERGKAPVIVPETALSYRVNSEAYENGWLGLSWHKPVDWRFSKFNPMWPDTAVVGLTNPEGGRVEIRMKDLKPWWTNQNAADEIFLELKIVEGAVRADRQGFPGFLAVGPSRAALVLIDGLTAWVIVAEGLEPGRLIDAATADLRIRHGGRPGLP
jgi:Transglutaminase-like superfamily